MADFTALKIAITNAIKQNGNQAITGNLLQEILIAMVESMGDTALNGLATSIQTSLNSLSAEDGNLSNAISSEASTRQSADNTLSSAINSEALTRSQADTTLQQNINNEAATRQSADATLQNQIMAEKNARVTDISRLQSLIDAINAIVGNGYTFGGIATINGAPQQGKMFYIALERGNYINYGGVSVHNGITLIYNNGQWISKELLDLDVFYGEILRIVNAYQPIVIEGNVTNAPDEEDLTSNNIGLLQFKNKAYAPSIFSGLGRKYLRKNIRPLTDSASFDGFVENVELEASLSGTPDAIFWDRINERFVGKKDDVYYQNWTDSDDYVPVSSELVYMNEGTPYRWDGTGLIVYDEIYPDLINMLTQEMISEANTIYHIQYDYVLGEDITVPENCVLEFDGGSISGAYTITGQITGINAALVKIFSTDVTFSGTWNVNEAYAEWFGAKGDNQTDCSEPINKTVYFAYKTCCTIRFLGNTYKISSPILLYNYKNITFVGSNVCNAPWKTPKCTIEASAIMDCMFKLVDDYQDKSIPTTAAREICIKDIYIDGNSKAVTAINCIDAKIENVTIRNCTGSGIVLEAQTYPVVILDSVIERCGKHGIHVKSPFTTVYTIERCECNSNDGYGMLIEGGYAGTAIKSVVLQGNKQGGLKLLQHDMTSEGYLYEPYLGYILFENIYCENNGLLSPDNINYDGNHTLYLKGINPTITSSSGKIDGLTFFNCQFTPSQNGNNHSEGATANAIGNTTFPNVIPGFIEKIRSNNLYLRDYPDSTINRYAIDSGNNRQKRLIDVIPYSFKIKYDNTNLTFNDDSTNVIMIGNYTKFLFFGRVTVNSEHPLPSTPTDLVLSLNPSPIVKQNAYVNRRYIIGSGFIGTTHCNAVLICNTNVDYNIYIVDDNFDYIKTDSITNGTLISLTIGYINEV